MNDDDGKPDRLNLIRSAAKPTDGDEFNDFRCWGCVRGNRRAFNIELRRLNGSWPAPEYSWLHYAEYCPVEMTLPDGTKVPSGSTLLHIQSGEKVIITGRKVREIHNRILAHQVYYVAEVDRASDLLAEDNEIVVSKITTVLPKRG